MRQGNIFTSVCHSVHRGRGVCPSACWDPPGQTPPRRPLQRTVRILLECFLVYHTYVVLYIKLIQLISTIDSSRTLRTPRRDLPSTRSLRSVYSDDSSPGHVSRPRSSSPAPSRLSSDRKMRELQVALDDSEKRRDVLRERLRDAQDTIQVRYLSLLLGCKLS